MDYVKEIKEKLAGVINAFNEEMGTIRSNRPNTKMVEDVKVNYLESEMTIKQLASINIEPPRDIVISPWDKDAIPAIEKGLSESAFGLNVSSAAGSIRAKLPEMTEEKINEIVSIVKNISENYKISVRTIRDEINKSVKEIKDEDERFRTKEDIQKEVDSANQTIDSMVEAKIKEVRA